MGETTEEIHPNLMGVISRLGEVPDRRGKFIVTHLPSRFNLQLFIGRFQAEAEIGYPRPKHERCRMSINRPNMQAIGAV